MKKKYRGNRTYKCPECGGRVVIYPAEGFLPEIHKCKDCGYVPF